MTVDTRSPFGGPWTDRVDADSQLERRLRGGRVSADLAAALSRWITDGYVILPGAADPAVCDRFAGELAGAWREGHPEQIVVDSRTGTPGPLGAGDETRFARAVDAHVHFGSAQELLRSPRVTEFLHAVFDADPLYFQDARWKREDITSSTCELHVKAAAPSASRSNSWTLSSSPLIRVSACCEGS